MEYYRFTDKDTVMSDWGHAMFATDREMVAQCYGCHEYHYNGHKAVAIETLYPVIAAEWETSKEFGLLPNGYEDVSADQICKAFNPDDIVMSAGAWDDGDLYQWFCDHIEAPYDISAVTTNDGAILFDESLATLATEEW